MSQQAPAPGASGDMVADIEKFQRHFKFHEEKVTFTFLMNQLNFLTEELKEAHEAIEERDADKLYDSVIDLIVVAVGTAEFMARGKTREGWVRVMNKNFQKTRGFNPKRPNSGGMDLIKPEGWTAPDHRDIVVDLQKILDNVTDEELEQVVNLADYDDMPSNDRGAVRVLMEAAEVMRKKSQDYANPDSSVRQADYYPNGLDDHIYMIDVLKRNRQISLVETLKKRGETYRPNNEDLEDTLIDRINYLAMAIEWLRGQTEGQNPNLDAFNRPKEAFNAEK